MEAGPAQSVALEVRGLSAGYGARKVLHDVSLYVQTGEIVAVLGHNGAGKTTLLQAIAGVIPPTSGEIEIQGVERRHAGIADNIAVVPSGRCVFATLSVMANLQLGGRLVHTRDELQRRLDSVIELFPILGERLKQRAGSMSGGEQRMLGVAVALMRNPNVLLLDEPSIGLAPKVVDSLFETLSWLANEQNVTVLLVEQSVKKALAISKRGYVMRSGSILLVEDAATLAKRDDLWELY